MAATATAEAKEKKTRAVKTCHLEQKKPANGIDWWPVKAGTPSDTVIFAGQTEAEKYVIDNGLTGTFRCVWTGPEFSAVEQKKVSIK